MIKGFTFLYWSHSRSLRRNAIVQGLVWAWGISLSVCFALGLWAMLAPAKSYYFPVLLGAGALLGVFAGGLVAGALAKNSGWFHGGLVGFCYGLIFLLLALVGGLEVYSGLDLAGRLGLSTCCGLAGGIVGVNISLPALKKRFASGKRFPGQLSRQ